ncbi:MAG: D-alanyl-D-alanine carboxypeptidase/D-alanyl-D-alanine-endopeptidase [Paracoccaceae bacterium]
MTHLISRRVFLSAALASVALPAYADAPARSKRPPARGSKAVAPVIKGSEDIIQSAKLSGNVNFAVADIATGRRLESRNGASAAPPASVTKSVTALYALDNLGAQHRFFTTLVATGGVTNGIVQGDLVLMGGGDPTLDSTDLANLAAQLKAKGIRGVEGKFLIFDRALPRIHSIDSGQPDHVGYNPAISGMALNFNRVHFEWRRGSNGYKVTLDARTAKYRPDVTTASMQIVNRDVPVYTYKSTPARDEWTVSRRALGKDGARWLPVPLQGLYAADVFRPMASRHGFVLPSAKTVSRAPTGIVLATHSSQPLLDILRDMLKYSNNLIAEMVGLAATQKRVGAVNSLKASGREMSRWSQANLGMARAALVDHSGLGEASRMTADDMCTAMVRVQNAGFRRLLKPIAMRDAKGRPQKNHPVKVDAKTGTLNFVSSLSGYVTTANGTELAFAIFTADLKSRSRIGKANREAPQGARGWNRRAKSLQLALIDRWATLYSR